MEDTNKEKIIQIVLCCVEEVNENLENKIDLEKGLKAHLYDWEGYLRFVRAGISTGKY